MKTFLLIFLFAVPAFAYVDPWAACNLWGEDITSVSLCRKTRAGQWRYEQQRLIEEQELKKNLQQKKRQRDK